ncbi:MAG: hypothetical protein RDV41_15090 [Planctomycetota bacterium]|nr:hypothetical protein [Planctomycetota bacterium]
MKILYAAAVAAFLVALLLSLNWSEEIGTSGPTGDKEGENADGKQDKPIETLAGAISKENERHKEVLTELRARIRELVEKIRKAKTNASSNPAGGAPPEAAVDGVSKVMVSDLAERLVDEGICYRVNLAHVLKQYRDRIVEAVAENLMSGKVPGDLLMDSFGGTESAAPRQGQGWELLFTDDLSILDGLRRTPQPDQRNRLFGEGGILDGSSEREGIE